MSMNKKTAITVGVTVILTLMVANKLRTLPVLNKLPQLG